VSSIDVHRQHYNVTFTLLALAAVAFSLLQSLVAGSQVTAGIVTATIAADGLPTENGFTIAFAASAVALAIGFLVAFAVPTGVGARKIAAFRQLEVGEWQRQ
jgi:hypothetical protein